ncbi:MAG TPA: protein kinase [Candidatus Sulfopaludibacter sp.]|jgi:tetratricopeptide (TPR) repeat protein|nr:protein kinase [Candidatus Sulfopaludibacter sp.]
MERAPEIRPQTAEEIFLAAASLPDASRAGFLNQACGDNRGLREDVESMLAFDCSASRDLGAMIGKAAASLVHVESHIGRRFGPYIATSLLGTGGMGAVYLAVRADDQIQKQVAIKLMKGGADSASLVERFRYERQILSTLDHPYIAKLLDAGTTESGLPYFVMEHIQGLPIDRYCDESKLSVEDRCELFRKVCEAVAYAHRNLVIHRDLKPSNILVTADGTPKLLDFGIAKILTPGAVTQTIVGDTGAMLALTPDYASPEQVRGEAVNTSTDVYSLGAVLFELLTGAKPHGITTYTPLEIERSVCEREVRKPSEVAADGVRQELTGDLDTIVLMAVRKEPQRRYQSVEQLSEDLRRYAAGLPVMAQDDKLAYRMGKFWRRHRLGVIAAALAAAGLIGGAAAASWEARRAHIQQRLAEQRLSQIAALANTTLIDIHVELERLQGATDARKKMVEATLVYLDSLSRSSGGDSGILDVLASAYMRMGDVQGLPDHPNLGDTKGAEASYRKALSVAQQGLALHPGQVALLGSVVDIEERLGSIYTQMGQTAAGLEHERAALAAAEKRVKLDPKSLESQNLLGSAHLEVAYRLATSKPDEALVQAQAALAICQPLAAAHPEDPLLSERISDIHSMLGRVYYQTGQMEQALEEYKQSAALRARLVGLRPNDRMARRELMLADAHIASTLRGPWSENLGRPAEALVYLGKAVEIAEALAANSPQDRLAQHDLANALLRQGLIATSPAGYAASLQSLRHAAAIVEGLAAHDSADKQNSNDLASIYESIGKRLMDMGRHSEAIAAYRKSFAIAQPLAAHDPNNPIPQVQVLASAHGLAMALAAVGDRAGALAPSEFAVGLADRLVSGGMTTPRMRIYKVRTRRWLGDIYRTLNDSQHARAAYTAGMEECQKLAPGKDSGEELKAIQSSLKEIAFSNH